MPLIRFTKLTDKLRSHAKQQTIRLPRKRPLEFGDVLHVYTIEKLGIAFITSIIRKRLCDLTIEDAMLDGFKSIKECQNALMSMHKCTLDEEFDIISFDPQWYPNHVQLLESE